MLKITADEALKKPKIKPDFEKFVADMAVASLVLLFVGAIVFGQENIGKSTPFNFGNRVKSEISYLYTPYVNKFQND